MKKEWVSIREAARYADVSESTIRRWVSKGLIRSYHVEGVSRYRTNEIDKLFEESEKNMEID